MNEYDFKKIYNKMVLAKLKSMKAPCPKVRLRQMILNDTTVFKLKTGRQPINKEVFDDCNFVLKEDPDHDKYSISRSQQHRVRAFGD